MLTIGTLTAVQVRYERRLLEDNLLRIAQSGLDVMGDTTREQMPATITELNEATLDELMFSALRQPEVARAQLQNGATTYQFGVRYFMVLNTDGRVIRSDRGEFTGRTLTEVPLPQGAQSQVRLASWSGERVFEAVAPITSNAGQRIGYMVMGMATDATDQISADIIRASLVIMLVALAATMALTALLTRRTLTPLAMLVDLTQSVTRGDLSRRIPEDRWDEIGRLARAFNSMVKGLSERERMRDLFGRYLSREVSEAVLAGAVRLGGERKVVSVIFADMRGSTSFAEGQAPEAVMLALNQYFEIIINATEANGGILARFLGDGALCIFGAPRELADHADCAVRATLAMRAGLSELNHWRAGRGLPILRFGIGINSGEVTAGATGSEQRQEYTIIGDAVNLASRIEEQTKQHPGYDILLSEFTHRALGPRAAHYRCAELGSFAIRGRSQPVIIFGLLGDVATEAAPPASAIRVEE